MTLELNELQQQALQISATAPLRLVNPQTNECYVLVPADTYDVLKNLLYEDEPSEEEKRRQLAASGERAGWADPEMDVYDDYDKNRNSLCP